MLDYKNGYMKPVVPVSVGKGGEPIHFNQISQNELDELAKFQPTLTYGQAKQVTKTRDVVFWTAKALTIVLQETITTWLHELVRRWYLFKNKWRLILKGSLALN